MTPELGHALNNLKSELLLAVNHPDPEVRERVRQIINEVQEEERNFERPAD